MKMTPVEFIDHLKNVLIMLDNDRQTKNPAWPVLIKKIEEYQTQTEKDWKKLFNDKIKKIK